ncbi:MAG: hypothetical protein ABI205_09330 [Gemmatimonadaceae bacterium]
MTFSIRLVITLSLVLGSAFVTVSASENTSGRVYSDRGALSAQTADLARVVMIRQVAIQSQPGHTAQYLGGAVGAATGYAVTRNSAGSLRGLGTILGGAGGAMAGGMISSHGTSHPAVQIFVQRLSDNGQPYGQIISVVQDDDQRIGNGQIVLLIRSRDGLSVAPVGAVP